MENTKNTQAVKKRKSLRRRFILTELEQQLYYQRPIFDDEERLNFFALNDEAHAFIKNSFPTSAVYAILQLGYFKAKQQFFHVTSKEAQYDIEWIHFNHFSGKTISKKLPSYNVQLIINNKIAKIMGYETNISVIKKYLAEQSKFFTKQLNDPAVIFKELFLCLKQHKILLPGYTTVQDIISEESNQEEKRLFQIVEQHLQLNNPIKTQLDILLGSEDKLNKIQDLKQDLTGFNHGAMKQEINLHQSNKSLYQFAKKLLPDFQISEHNIHYYAYCINYYSPYELNQLPKITSYLYLLCYTYHRYQKMNDNLMQASIYHIDKTKKSGSIYASSTYSQEQKKLLANADPKSIGLLIGNYANDSLLKLHKEFNDVAKEAYKIIPKEMIIQISQKMINQDTYKMELEWQYYHEHHRIMELNIRPIFRALDFQADKNNHSLIEAANFLKDMFNKGISLAKVASSKFPKNVIPKKLKKIIIDPEGKIRPYHYEFLVYAKLRDHLIKNIVYLNDSIQYKSFDEDAKSTLENGDKEKLLQKMNKPKLLTPIKDRLQKLEEEVEELFIEVNKNIDNSCGYDIFLVLHEGIPNIKDLPKETKLPALIKHENEFFIYGRSKKGKHHVKKLDVNDELKKYLEGFDFNSTEKIRVSPIQNKEIFKNIMLKNGHAITKNKNFSIKLVGEEISWNLKYPKAEKEFNHKFYEKLPVINISDVFDFINDECNLISAFKHFRTKDVKGEIEYQAIKGGIIAEGTRQGNFKMASCSNLDYETLRRNKQNYIREKSIRGACKKVIKKMSQLPIAKASMLGGKHFSGIDGSKKGTSKKNAQARHSPKYFGLSRGLSVMCMVMDNMFVNNDYISCNEYEGHHLYDLYFNSDAEFEPDVITADSHGSNKLNYPLFDALDIELYICYKNLFEKCKQLSGFQPLENYENMLIKPSKKVNTGLIIGQDKNIRDIFITIFSKMTKQSTLIKKLCNHGRKTVLKKAIWEYNNIFFTKFCLMYINDPAIQKYTRISLNRVEANNKFYNSIVKIGGKKFKGKSEINIGIENQATRLLMLIISFYNMYILSAAYEKKKAEKDYEAMEMLMNISSMATQHLNLTGMYHFGDSKEIDISNIIKALTDLVDKSCHKKKKGNTTEKNEENQPEKKLKFN